MNLVYLKLLMCTWPPPRSSFMLGLGAAAAWKGLGCSAKGFLAPGCAPAGAVCWE